MLPGLDQPLSYCGAPPLPADIWGRWTLDPVLIAVMAGIAIAYAVGHQRARLESRATATQAVAFYAGWAIVAAAFISPLCSLSVALFSARVTQHMVLMLVAAPLLALGRPDLMLAGKTSPPKWVASASKPVAASLTFALFLWLWHAPAPYDASLRNDALYWAMHLTLLGSAYIFWHGHMVALTAGRKLLLALTSLATAMHMGLLGALITFSGQALYESHAYTTIPWGLPPLADQQLGGLIMWVPGGLAFVISGLWAGAGLLRQPQKVGS